MDENKRLVTQIPSVGKTFCPLEDQINVSGINEEDWIIVALAYESFPVGALFLYAVALTQSNEIIFIYRRWYLNKFINNDWREFQPYHYTYGWIQKSPVIQEYKEKKVLAEC
jgi:hypothetical protein